MPIEASERARDICTDLLGLWRARALHSALLVSLGASGACTDLPELDPDREDGACEDGVFRFADTLRAQGFDYVELRYDMLSELIDSAGTPCKTASDRAACMTALASPVEPTRFCINGSGCPEIVGTRGDVVLRITTGAELVEQFGEVASIEAAQAVVWLDRFANVCSDSGFGALPHGDGFWVYGRAEGCVSDDFTKRYTVSGEGAVTAEKVVRGERIKGCLVGRLPAGLIAELQGSGSNPVGRLFSQMASMEAVSVVAFLELATALRAHGAPEGWARAAERFAGDELRHASEVAGLARRFGACLTMPEVKETCTPALLQLAIENAVEGCIRETYGAMVAALQAQQARDPGVRAVMLELADDELEHAALSHQVAQWVTTKLSADERAEVARAARGAIGALRADAQQSVSPALTEVAGWPSPKQALALLDSLEANAWQNVACA